MRILHGNKRGMRNAELRNCGLRIADCGPGCPRSQEIHSAFRIPHSAFHHGRRGFTLIEVLAALVIFGVAIVGIIEGVGTALTFQADLAMRQRAAMLASNVMEEIKYSGDLAEGSDSGQFEGDDASFLWDTAIEPTEIPGLMRVTATVSWGAQDQENPPAYSIAAFMYDQGASLEGTEDMGEQPPQNPEPTPPAENPPLARE